MQGYLLFASLTIFLSAMTRVKQSGQANRTPPYCERDNGRIVAASTRRLHSGHRLIFEGSLPIKFKIFDQHDRPASELRPLAGCRFSLFVRALCSLMPRTAD